VALTSHTVSSTVLGHSTVPSRCRTDQGCCQCRPVWVLSRCMAQCSMAAGCHSRPCCRCCILSEGRLGGQGSLQASTTQHSQLITSSMLLSQPRSTTRQHSMPQHQAEMHGTAANDRRGSDGNRNYAALRAAQCANQPRRGELPCCHNASPLTPLPLPPHPHHHHCTHPPELRCMLHSMWPYRPAPADAWAHVQRSTTSRRVRAWFPLCHAA
jgi:hypothetical protein